MTGHISKFFTLFAFAAAFSLACKKADEPAEPTPPAPPVEVVTMPHSITLSLSGPVELSWGSSLTLSFQVTPESALEGLALEDLAGIIRLEGSTGGTPEGYTFADLQHSGSQFTATLADNKSKGSYKDRVVLVYAREDSKGRLHQIRSDAFEVVSNSFVGPSTGLPVVFLDTPDAQPIVSKEEWIEKATVRIFKADGTLDYDGSTSVKGRGNSTWTQFPKKPYALKLDSKSEILGMAKHKRWCLLANWMDRTLIRNAVAFEIARKTDLAWTPSGQFVELVLNGKHNGNYFLCEQVKVDKNRVNLSDAGFLMEIDEWFDEAFKFRSAINNVPWQFKDPDEVTEADVASMQEYVNNFEAALYDDTRFAAREYRNYIDSDSFADWWLANELARNGDVNQPKSIYISKEPDGVLTAGPVWDFDWGTFIPAEYTSGGVYNYDCTGPRFYINRIRRDSAFRSLVKQRWTRYREPLQTIPAYIDALAASLAASDAINIKMWPIDRTTNKDVDLSFTAAVARLKRAYQEKYEWLDNEIMNTY